MKNEYCKLLVECKLCKNGLEWVIHYNKDWNDLVYAIDEGGVTKSWNG